MKRWIAETVGPWAPSDPRFFDRIGIRSELNLLFNPAASGIHPHDMSGLVLADGLRAPGDVDLASPIAAFAGSVQPGIRAELRQHLHRTGALAPPEIDDGWGWYVSRKDTCSSAQRRGRRSTTPVHCCGSSRRASPASSAMRRRTRRCCCSCRSWMARPLPSAGARSPSGWERPGWQPRAGGFTREDIGHAVWSAERVMGILFGWRFRLDVEATDDVVLFAREALR